MTRQHTNRLPIPRLLRRILREQGEVTVFYQFRPARARLLEAQDAPPGGRFLLPGDEFEVPAGLREKPEAQSLSWRSRKRVPEEVPAVVRIPANVLGLQIRLSDGWEGQEWIEAGSEREKLELGSAVAVGTDEAYLLAPVASSCVDTVDAFGLELEGLPKLLEPKEYLEDLALTLDAHADRRKRAYRRWFFHMDRVSDENLAATYLGSDWEDYYKKHVALVMNHVLTRLEARAKEEAGSTGSYTPAIGTESLTISLQFVSNLLVGIMKAELAVDGEVSYPMVEEAFEMFANGELRLQLPETLVWTTQPSTNYFFLFAEFAFLCWENDVDADHWEKTLNVLVRCQEIYARVFQADGAAPESVAVALGASTGCAYREDQALTASEKAELRASYEWMTSSELAVKAAQNALKSIEGIAT